MNSGFTRWLCAAVVAGISVGPVAALTAEGNAPSSGPAARVAAEPGPTPDKLIIDLGDAPLSVMSRVELSQVTSNKAAPRREAGVDNRVKLPVGDSADSTKVKIDSTGGFLIVDIRQSTGFANNQVNTARIHAP